MIWNGSPKTNIKTAYFRLEHCICVSKRDSQAKKLVFCRYVLKKYASIKLRCVLNVGFDWSNLFKF